MRERLEEEEKKEIDREKREETRLIRAIQKANKNACTRSRKWKEVKKLRGKRFALVFCQLVASVPYIVD